jgi:SNF2 family DNA or RNA helicase
VNDDALIDDLKIPKPWRHQLEYVDFAVRYKRTAAVHDTGVGKTRSAIMVADRIHARRILVICPTIALTHWVAQFAKYSAIDRSTVIVRSPQQDIAFVDIVLVSFDTLSTHESVVRRLVQYTYDLCIIDEAHALKNRDSKRTVAAYGPDAKGGLAQQAPTVVLCTATLMPNHPGELWTHLAALRPELLKAPGYDSFVDRYCQTKMKRFGRRMVETVVGAQRGPPLDDLRRRLETFRHRVRKKDVLDLPPLVINAYPVDIQDLEIPAEILEAWRKSEADMARSIGSATGEAALALARSSEHASTNRRLTGVVKTAAMIAALKQELDGSPEKVIAFAYHQEVMRALERAFIKYGVVTLDGRTPQWARIEFIKAFQTDPKRRLLNGQISVAGESIDLTAASSVWIMESDWTPKTITQAIGRAHRPGQVRTVNVHVLTLGGSIDEAIARVLIRKAEDIALLMEPAA